MDENKRNKRSNVKLGLNILVFYTKVSELAEKVREEDDLEWYDLFIEVR